MQVRYCADADRCISGSAPRLNTLTEAYGYDASVLWLGIQIHDLSEYTGCKGKISNEQIEELANIILTEYGGLKMTEIMLFFFRFKAGHYGHFYGSVDTMVIMDAMRQFFMERSEKLWEINEKQIRQAKAKADEEHRARAVSYTEYIKNKNNENNTTNP